MAAISRPEFPAEGGQLALKADLNADVRGGGDQLRKEIFRSGRLRPGNIHHTQDLFPALPALAELLQTAFPGKEIAGGQQTQPELVVDPHFHVQPLVFPDDLIQLKEKLPGPDVGLRQRLIFPLQLRALFVQLGHVHGLHLGVLASAGAGHGAFRKLPQLPVGETEKGRAFLCPRHTGPGLSQRPAQLFNMLQIGAQQLAAEPVHLPVAEDDDAVPVRKADAGGQVVKGLLYGRAAQLWSAVE